MNRFWIILAVVVIGFIGIFIATKPESSKTSIEEARKIVAIDHTKWSSDAKVTLIEYGDFQCPGCASYYPIIKQMEETYKDDVRFVFRHFPLRTIHPNAQAAALAAEAASKQGKFWEMHDKLFETQQSWGQITTNQQKLFESYADELELDIDQFKTDYASSETAARINRDLDSGKLFGVDSTPSFVLNGKLIDTPSGLEEFSKLLDKAIKNAGGTPPESSDKED